jgi:hypothetical protein
MLKNCPPNPQRETVLPVAEPSSYDPFDPENLRIDPAFMNETGAKKLLTTIPVRRPGKQSFVRVHPEPGYRLNVALVELEEDREIYLVPGKFAPVLEPNEYYLATLYLCITRQKVLSLWPVKLPAPDGRQIAWHTSAADPAQRAMTRWIKMTANRALGAYEVYEAERNFGEPEWPEYSFQEIPRIAFKDRIIETPDHPVILKLRGKM